MDVYKIMLKLQYTTVETRYLLTYTYIPIQFPEFAKSNDATNDVKFDLLISF